MGICTGDCLCKNKSHEGKRIVLTGGPGAGKTAVLEIVKKNFCNHIAILPESASIIFSGGFWRKDSIPAKKAAQRAIYHVQKELEQLAIEEQESAIILCDRGTIDGLAYWPCEETLFWQELETTKEKEFSKYSAVIHLRTPTLEDGYNHSNPVRIETVKQARKIDEHIRNVWAGHPKRFLVDSTKDFIEKVYKTVELIRSEVPECCKKHALIFKNTS
ncbi:MAG: ATP-binding protein [Candidatus Melainabacteria bacterium]|nr:ATP-binding protein [Candidatus Melainabacteria bacterium]